MPALKGMIRNRLMDPTHKGGDFWRWPTLGERLKAKLREASS